MMKHLLFVSVCVLTVCYAWGDNISTETNLNRVYRPIYTAKRSDVATSSAGNILIAGDDMGDDKEKDDRKILMYALIATGGGLLFFIVLIVYCTKCRKQPVIVYSDWDI